MALHRLSDRNIWKRAVPGLIVGGVIIYASPSIEKHHITRPSRARIISGFMNQAGLMVRNKTTIGMVTLVLAAVIAAFTAMAHTSCLILGPSCYQAQMAPEYIIQSAINGTWLAPIATLAASFLFLLCSAYALSAAGIFRRLPLLGPVVYGIAVLCVARGLATLPLSLMFPEKVSSFSIIAGLLWFSTGLLFFFGYHCAQPSHVKYQKKHQKL